MKLLLDTHAMLWWWTDPERLPQRALNALRDARTEIFVSAVSAYEIADKNKLGKLQLPPALLDRFDTTIREERWTPLPVSLSHSLLAGRLAWEHRDPFDRLLAAQSALENAPLVTADPAFANCPGLRCLWG